MTQQPAGWYADPTRRHTYRYWDGSTWSNQVSDGGTSGLDPTEMDATSATTPPAPGTQAPGARTTTPTVEVTQRSGGTGIGTIVGILIGVVIVILIVVALMNDSGDDGTTSTTDSPATTVAPATTLAPATTGG